MSPDAWNMEQPAPMGEPPWRGQKMGCGSVATERCSNQCQRIGESTYIAAWTGMPRLSGVDSDPTWISLVRDQETIHDNFQFHFGDIGPTGDWGFPKKLGLTKQIFRYVLAPLSLERKPFEIYLVDGRFRVACACASFLHAMSTGADMERVKVLVHDHQERSWGYQIIETLAKKSLWQTG